MYSSAPEPCPKGGWEDWIPGSDFCYKAFASQVSWDNADQECKKNGSTLVRFDMDDPMAVALESELLAMELKSRLSFPVYIDIRWNGYGTLVQCVPQ